ncbi:MAG: asparagine--tRNA ligase [Thermoproteota archaeon]|nr:MAG: asparagine--tRNA ligase [Candidatus Korarchaeota archaeon]HDN02175.1 asparagine--tRNA ligase [Candidatus Bathyarchaeota archaeon]
MDTEERTEIQKIWGLPQGSEVKIRGWIYTKSHVGGMLFINIRDSTGIVQAVFKEDVLGPKFQEILPVGRESSIILTGEVNVDERAPMGREIIVKDFEVVGGSRDYPVRPGMSVETLLDLRHLYLRGRKPSAVMKIRSEVLKALREWFDSNGYVETTAPTFVSSAVEGGATLFPVNYFGKEVYLTQSSQFYLEAMIFSLEKVYTIQPSFRAEKSRTRRHLCEYTHAEAEIAYADLNDIMDVCEKLVKYVCKVVVERCKNELEILNREFEPLKDTFPRITYDEALKICEEEGVNIEWGEDLSTEAERAICRHYGKPVFVYKFPKSTRAFYHMPDPENEDIVLSTDLIAPEDTGELIGGGQRISDYNLLKKRILEEIGTTEGYEWYLDLRRYGSVPHAGFGLGVERLVKWIAGLSHIRDAIPFPRTPARVYP